MTEDILFDNLLITDDISVADKLAEDRFVIIQLINFVFMNWFTK